MNECPDNRSPGIGRGNDGPNEERRPAGRWSDRTVELAMSLVLRVGVAVAAALVAGGGIAYLIQDGDREARYGHFAAVRSLSTPVAIVHGALALDPAAIIALGLIVLVLTPVTRVAFALVAFAEQRDRLYVVFSLIVLIVLFIGLTGHAL